MAIIEQEKNTRVLSEMFLALLPAQILSSLTASLGSIINGILIGNYLPAAALSALGLVNPVIQIVSAFAAIISGGCRILCGRFIGRSDSDGVNASYSVAMSLSFSMGAVITIILFVFAKPIAIVLGASGETIVSTTAYLQSLAIGIIPTVMVPAMMIFLQMIGDANYAFLSSVVLAGANLVLAEANLRFLSASVFGMGIAVSLAQYIAFVFLLVKIKQRKDHVRFVRESVTKSLSIDMVKLGSPTALALFLYSSRNILLNVIVVKFFGELPLQALAIGNSAVAPFDAINIGVGAVALALSSMYVGEKDDDALAKLLTHTLKIGWLLAYLKLFALIFLGKEIAILFGATGDLVPLTRDLLICLGINMPINIATLALVNPYQSLGKIKFVNILYCFNAFIFPLSWCLISANIIGIRAIWISYSVAEALTLIAIGLHQTRHFHHFPRTAREWLGIEAVKFPGTKISFSARNKDEVINISEEIIEFCKLNNIDDKKSFACGLCMEELAENAFEHGIDPDKAYKYVVDIFICCEGDKVSMKLRNNTPAFDPRTKLTAFDPEDPAKNMGIRMVNKLAKSMVYQTTFGMNAINIEL